MIDKNHFNSHAHVERDKIKSQVKNSRINFNSHAHVERDLWLMVYARYILYFNSHAHVERDILDYEEYTDKLISTHTLTWSVTHSIIKHFPK